MCYPKSLVYLLSALLLTTLVACGTAPTRQWLDGQTAVTVTAQTKPVVLAREDFPAGVNVRDYAELGLFDINRAGDHRHYLALVLWSTVDRSADELIAQSQAFAQITVWCNDRPLLLKRLTDDEQSLLLSAPVFRLPSPNARMAYYLLSDAELNALGNASQLTLMPANVASGERPYALWRGELQDIRAFVAQLPR